MSKFKPGDMAKTLRVSGFPTWSDRTVLIVEQINPDEIPLFAWVEFPGAREWYAAEIIDGLGATNPKECATIGEGAPNCYVVPDTHLIPLDPPKEDHIPRYVRRFLDLEPPLRVGRREKVKA